MAKDLAEMTDKEIREELKRRREQDGELRVEKGKKEGVVVVWPPSRRRFPLAAQAMTWIEILDDAEKIRDFCSEIIMEDSESSSSKKSKKVKKNGKKKKRKKSRK